MRDAVSRENERWRARFVGFVGEVMGVPVEQVAHVLELLLRGVVDREQPADHADHVRVPAETDDVIERDGVIER